MIEPYSNCAWCLRLVNRKRSEPIGTPNRFIRRSHKLSLSALIQFLTILGMIRWASIGNPDVLQVWFKSACTVKSELHAEDSRYQKLKRTLAGKDLPFHIEWSKVSVDRKFRLGEKPMSGSIICSRAWDLDAWNCATGSGSRIPIRPTSWNVPANRTKLPTA